MPKRYTIKQALRIANRMKTKKKKVPSRALVPVGKARGPTRRRKATNLIRGVAGRAGMRVKRKATSLGLRSRRVAKRATSAVRAGGRRVAGSRAGRSAAYRYSRTTKTQRRVGGAVAITGAGGGVYASRRKRKKTRRRR